MSRQTEFVLKRGATGAVMTAVLKDKNGALKLKTGVQLWDVKVSLRKGNELPAIDEDTCTVEMDQDSFPGQISYSFLNTSEIEKGVYFCEFKAIDPNGNVHIFPSNKRERYARVLVQESLS